MNSEKRTDVYSFKETMLSHPFHTVQLAKFAVIRTP